MVNLFQYKTMILGLIFILPIGLWISSILILKDWKHFGKFFTLNSILVSAYFILITQLNNKSGIGSDPYGLGKLFMLLITACSHVIIVFIYALFKRKKLK